MNKWRLNTTKSHETKRDHTHYRKQNVIMPTTMPRIGFEGYWQTGKTTAFSAPEILNAILSNPIQNSPKQNYHAIKESTFHRQVHRIFQPPGASTRSCSSTHEVTGCKGKCHIKRMCASSKTTAQFSQL